MGQRLRRGHGGFERDRMVAVLRDIALRKEIWPIEITDGASGLISIACTTALTGSTPLWRQVSCTSPRSSWRASEARSPVQAFVGTLSLSGELIRRRHAARVPLREFL